MNSSEGTLHAPHGYRSPFLDVVEGLESPGLLTKQSDVFYRDAQLTAFVAAARYQAVGGNALVMPNEPYENLYSLPDETLCALHKFSKQLAIAFKTVYRCDGVLLRQHNEPAGSQEVWHYHLHVIPRFHGDGFYTRPAQKTLTTAEEREPFARSLRAYSQALKA